MTQSVPPAAREADVPVARSWRDRIVAALPLVYLALMPIAWPQLMHNARLIDLLLPVIAVLVLVRYHGRWEWRPLDYGVAAYLLSLTPSLLITDDVGSSIVELVKRIYLGGVYVVFALYFKTIGSLASGKTIVRTAAAISGVGLVAVGFYAAHGVDAGIFGRTFTLPYFGRVLRPTGGAESPEMFANYLTFALPFIGAAAVSNALRRTEWVAAAGLVVAGIVLSLTHAVVGFVVAGLAIAWPFLRRGRAAAIRGTAVAATVAVFLLVNGILVVMIRGVDWRRDFDASVPLRDSAYGFLAEQGAERFTVRVSYNVMTYYVLKQVAWEAFVERPWTGIGLGRYPAYTERAQGGSLRAPIRSSDPHSTLFGTLAETGIVGIFGTAVLIVVALRQALERRPQRWFVIASRAAVLGLVINSLNVDIMNFRFLWVAFAGLREVNGPSA